jgi:hypothetical protein
LNIRIYNLGASYMRLLYKGLCDSAEYYHLFVFWNS